MSKLIKNLFSRFIIMRYLFAGGFSTAIGLVLLYVFTDLLKIWYLYSSTLSFIVAFSLSFVLQKWWTFVDYSADRTYYQVFCYFGVVLIDLVFNLGLMYLFVDKLNLWYLLAQVITSGLIATGNFLVYRYTIFKTCAPYGGIPRTIAQICDQLTKFLGRLCATDPENDNLRYLLLKQSKGARTAYHSRRYSAKGVGSGLVGPASLSSLN